MPLRLMLFKGHPYICEQQRSRQRYSISVHQLRLTERLPHSRQCAAHGDIEGGTHYGSLPPGSFLSNSQGHRKATM